MAAHPQPPRPIGAITRSLSKKSPPCCYPPLLPNNLRHERRDKYI